MNTIRTFQFDKSGFAAAALAVAMGTTAIVAFPTPVTAQTANDRIVVLSIGNGEQVNMGSAITDVVVSDPHVADVEVRSARQIYIVGKGAGETTVYATNAAGKTIYQATVRVGGNLGSLQSMMDLAMPESAITVTTMSGVVLLTGTVLQPEDAAEAERLATAFVGTGTQVISRLKNATPLQVNLQVRIAEVSRSLVKEINGNLQSMNSDGTFWAARRTREFIEDGGPINSGKKILNADVGTIGAIGRLFGIDIGAAFDMSERAGLSSTLANPNLTTISGETAEFLAGGRFPIVTSSNNGVSVQYEQYGVGLTYTPTVMADGRISLRVRSEVSDISSQGAVRIDGLEVPATTTRMAETTVQLGSGESIMLAGMLKNSMGSSVSKMPGLGDVPILGSLFKSNGWRREETELMIVVTPYLVKPVSESEIRLPTDGLETPNDAERVLLNQVTKRNGNVNRPMPSVATERSTDAPLNPMGSGMPASAMSTSTSRKVKTTQVESAAGPGFSFSN